MASTIRLPELNAVLITGRLTHDTYLRVTQKGQSVCSFDMAVNRRYKDPSTGEWKDDTAFVPVVVWGAAADRCKDRLKRGVPVMVEGRLSLNEYTDKTGQKRRILRVISRRLQILSPLGEAAASTESSGEHVAAESSGIAEEAEPVAVAQADEPAASSDGLDDVPF